MTTHLVPFHGETIIIIETASGAFTPVKPLCERFGVSIQKQLEKFRRVPERWGVTLMVIPSARGEQETACLPVSKLAAWLVGIDISRIKPEYREALTLYQNEADRVLDAHFRLRQHGQEEALARLTDQQRRLRAWALAFNPIWNRVARLQEAGIERGQVEGYFLGRPRAWLSVTMEQMEAAGAIALEDWPDGASWAKFYGEKNQQDQPEQEAAEGLTPVTPPVLPDGRTGVEALVDAVNDALGG